MYKRFYFTSCFIVLLLVASFMLYSKNVTPAPSKYRTATLPKNYVIYRAEINSKYLYCDIRINDLKLLNNRRSTLGYIQGRTSFNEFMQNGANTIGVDVAPWGFFDDASNYSEQERSHYPEHLFSEERFAEDAFCEVRITASTYKERKEDQRTVGILKIEIDEKGQVVTPSVNQESLSLTKIKRDDLVYTDDVYELSRNLNAKGLPHWVWVDSPKYEDIPNNRQLLEEAYYELWQAFNKKDEKKLRELLDISMYEVERANSTLDPLDEEYIQGIYDGFGYSDLNSEIKEMLPFNVKDYNVMEYADGRVVRLFKKDGDKSSIRYIKNNGANARFNHYMSFIDGKFRVVR